MLTDFTPEKNSKIKPCIQNNVTPLTSLGTCRHLKRHANSGYKASTSDSNLEFPEHEGRFIVNMPQHSPEFDTRHD